MLLMFDECAESHIFLHLLLPLMYIIDTTIPTYFAHIYKPIIIYITKMRMRKCVHNIHIYKFNFSDTQYLLRNLPQCVQNKCRIKRKQQKQLGIQIILEICQHLNYLQSSRKVKERGKK